MLNRLQLKDQKVIGKRKVATKALRNAGVPRVLYGGDQPVHFSAEESI
jgi:ribosomal protein L25 (general stress protein Ctc)